MLDRILTVGGFTLVSRVHGFMRDMMLAAILGAGPVADAFFIALRLPNHFRAIFAEGAFNAAFVPAYARIRGQAGAAPARLHLSDAGAGHPDGGPGLGQRGAVRGRSRAVGGEPPPPAALKRNA